MELQRLKELRDKKAFQIAQEDELRKVIEALESIRPEAADEILKQLSPPASEPPAPTEPVAQPSLPAEANQPALLTQSKSHLFGKQLLVSLVSGAALVFGIWAYSTKIAPLAKKETAPSPNAFLPLTREELNQRIAGAIASTQTSRVIYEDILGEGSGAWDPSPRYPSGIVNCILWVDQVLSEAYGAGLADKTPVMDQLRYFRGQVGFGLRKHFIPQWLGLESEPLRRVPFEKYTRRIQHQHVTHEFDHFRKIHGYTCPFYRMDQKSFVLDYVSPDTLLGVARELPTGFYFLFAVPTARYQTIYGAKSGPLGLVHGLILEVGEEADEDGAEKSLIVHHASTSARKVMHQPLTAYVAEMKKKLHKGYVIYEADPAWNFENKLGPDPETLSIQQCEKTLSASGGRRSAGLK